MNGIGNVVLPTLKMAPNKPSRDYLAASRYLLIGAELLSQPGNEKAIAAWSHLVAQSLECVLKAYLVKQGITVEKLSIKPYSHDLNKLWEETAARGLKVSAQPPSWCRTLNQTHGFPYILRYPMKINGFSIPPVSNTMTKLNKLIGQVAAVLRTAP